MITNGIAHSCGWILDKKFALKALSFLSVMLGTGMHAGYAADGVQLSLLPIEEQLNIAAGGLTFCNDPSNGLERNLTQYWNESVAESLESVATERQVFFNYTKYLAYNRYKTVLPIYLGGGASDPTPGRITFSFQPTEDSRDNVRIDRIAFSAFNGDIDRAAALLLNGERFELPEWQEWYEFEYVAPADAADAELSDADLAQSLLSDEESGEEDPAAAGCRFTLESVEGCPVGIGKLSITFTDATTLVLEISSDENGAYSSTGGSLGNGSGLYFHVDGSPALSEEKGVLVDASTRKLILKR